MLCHCRSHGRMKSFDVAAPAVEQSLSRQQLGAIITLLLSPPRIAPYMPPPLHR
jgi:hypothetical protein